MVVLYGFPMFSFFGAGLVAKAGPVMFKIQQSRWADECGVW